MLPQWTPPLSGRVTGRRAWTEEDEDPLRGEVETTSVIARDSNRMKAATEEALAADCCRRVKSFLGTTTVVRTEGVKPGGVNTG